MRLHQVIDALEDRESYEKLHNEWKDVVQEIEGQNKFIATLQTLVEKQEKQLLNNKGIATELAAAKNELAAFDKQMTGLRQEARAFAMQKEKDLENAHSISRERLAEQKLLHEAERDELIAQHRAEMESQTLKLRAELSQMEKDAQLQLENLTADASKVERRLAEQIESIREDADACMQDARRNEQNLYDELEQSKSELEISSAELNKASDVIRRVSEELQSKTAEQQASAMELARMEEELHGLKWNQKLRTEESEKALRMMHDSLTALNDKYEERGCTLQELVAEKKKLEEQATAMEKSMSELTAALKGMQSRTLEIAQAKDDALSEKTQMMSNMESSLEKLLVERENMKNERDLAQSQLKHMQHQMSQVAEGRTTQADLIRTTLESQLVAMQEEFRNDMEKLHEENNRQMMEQKARTQEKIRALEQSTDDLQKDRTELVEQLEVVARETLTDDHMARLSADNRALRLQVQELQENIKHLSTSEPSVVGDNASKPAEPSGTTEELQMKELEEVVVAQNKELKNVLKQLQELQEEKRKLTDSCEEMEQTEKVWS